MTEQLAPKCPMRLCLYREEKSVALVTECRTVYEAEVLYDDLAMRFRDGEIISISDKGMMSKTQMTDPSDKTKMGPQREAMFVVSVACIAFGAYELFGMGGGVLAFGVATFMAGVILNLERWLKRLANGP